MYIRILPETVLDLPQRAEKAATRSRVRRGGLWG